MSADRTWRTDDRPPNLITRWALGGLCHWIMPGIGGRKVHLLHCCDSDLTGMVDSEVVDNRRVLRPQMAHTSLFSPQLQRAPVESRKSEWLCPRATLAMFVLDTRDSTRVGPPTSSALPWPSFPALPDPHVSTCPSAVTTPLCSRPAAMLTTLESPKERESTVVGSVRTGSDCAHCPSALRPLRSGISMLSQHMRRIRGLHSQL